MKTQLLHLDSFDDAASTREKLRWVQAGRVVVVWPAYGQILNRRLDLVLLQREAARQGARLGLVCHDPEVRDHAGDLGIPVFDDPESIVEDLWASIPAPASRPAPLERTRPPLPPAPSIGDRSDHPAGGTFRRALWTGLVALALLALASVAGPVAAVELQPVSRTVTATFPVVFRTGDPADGGAVWVPARRLVTQVEGQLRTPVEGRVEAATGFAQGQVTFTNRGADEVVIPEGTGLRSERPGVPRFVTTDRALLPAGPQGQVVVPIRAAVPGRSGNVEAGVIDAIEGTLGLQLKVVNPEATLGGTDTPVPGVTQQDEDRVRDALLRQLLQQANSRWADLLDEGEVLLPSSIRVVRTMLEEGDPPLGEPSETLMLRLRLEVESAAYPAEALERSAAEALRPVLEDGWELFPGTIRIDLAVRGASSERGWPYRAAARAQAYDSGLGDRTPASIASLRIDHAIQALDSQAPLAAAPEVRVWPTWWPWLPVLPWRIEVVRAEAPR